MTKHDVTDFMTKDERNHLAGEFDVTGLVFLDEVFWETAVERINLFGKDCIPFIAIRKNLGEHMSKKPFQRLLGLSSIVGSRKLTEYCRTGA